MKKTKQKRQKHLKVNIQKKLLNGEGFLTIVTIHEVNSNYQSSYAR